MPPYRREILASSFMASKSGAACGNKYDNTIAAAAEKVEWPEGYAGKFGSPITVVMPGSSCTGRGLKYVYLTPQQLDPGITTVIGLPNFPAYPSGHSTFSAAAAMVLSYLFPQAAPDFDAMKDEASISRLCGGIHYRSDIERGKEHGARIGWYAVRFAQQDGAN